MKNFKIQHFLIVTKKNFLKIEIVFFGTFFRAPIRSIDMKITLDVTLCERTLTDIVLDKTHFSVSFYMSPCR